MTKKQSIFKFIFFLIISYAGNLLFASDYNIKDYGAVGDGKTIDSPAINKAIDAAAEAGGGTVCFPAGTYLCFTIRLKSHIGLFLDHGALILAADPADHKGGYDPAEPNEWDMYQDHGHSHWQNSLIWGEGLTDISISGPGKIYGKGLRTGRQSGKSIYWIYNKAIPDLFTYDTCYGAESYSAGFGTHGKRK